MHKKYVLFKNISCLDLYHVCSEAGEGEQGYVCDAKAIRWVYILQQY